ncbi:MAG: hypothetical protein J6F30_00450, partial [Cellulosilyticum sp.]|nr:hypothetical protein [Cellulosilyticum sp.]
MKIYKKLAIALCTGILMMTPLQGASLNCINQNSTNCVPIRAISEEFGATISIQNKAITISVAGREINLTLGSKKAIVNGEEKELVVAPQAVNGTTYVPVRFIAEALGGQVNFQNGKLTVTIDGVTKDWDVKTVNTNATTTTNTGNAFSKGSKTVQGKKVNYVKINMNDPRVKVNIATANNKVTAAAALKTLATGAKASINGTYFAAYNGDVPLPDGTLVKNGKVLHITDIGSTIGFTADNKVLIDFVRTRVQGYVNGEEAWTSYRVNRPGPDTSATLLYTPEHGGKVSVPSGWSAVVCIDGKVNKIVHESREVPANGFLLVTARPERFNVGDTVSYKTTYEPTYTSASDWENVTYALSAGPSLRINGQATGDPKNESFTEAKILTQVAQRSFIGVDAQGYVTIGTTSAS